MTKGQEVMVDAKDQRAGHGEHEQDVTPSTPFSPQKHHGNQGTYKDHCGNENCFLGVQADVQLTMSCSVHDIYEQMGEHDDSAVECWPRISLDMSHPLLTSSGSCPWPFP